MSQFHSPLSRLYYRELTRKILSTIHILLLIVFVACQAKPLLLYISDEDQALESLPKKMRSDLAINVHLGTLSKVKIFKVC